MPYPHRYQYYNDQQKKQHLLRANIRKYVSYLKLKALWNFPYDVTVYFVLTNPIQIFNEKKMESV